MSDKTNLSVPVSRKLKGRALSRIDQEQKMISSGPLGKERLILNIALDFMEKHPGMSLEHAMIASVGYCDRTHS
ncbi:hypothetical protein [Kosakonia sp. YIM B13611]|uniref:hypothetical protein n=1 Tax=unclassified Kosakonia TaxID=2632876 RepID=UPI0036897F7E